MSDSKSEAAESAEENEHRWSSSGNPHDWFLAKLADYANEGLLSCGITISVGGSLISGTLIGGKDYFEGLKDIIRSARFTGNVSENSKSDIAELFGEGAELYIKPQGADDDWTQPKPGYIHLRDARVITPSGYSIPNGGTLWRARLNTVDAFMLGEVNTSTE